MCLSTTGISTNAVSVLSVPPISSSSYYNPWIISPTPYEIFKNSTGHYSIKKAKPVAYAEDVNLAGYKKSEISISIKRTGSYTSDIVITAVKGDEDKKKTRVHTIHVDTFKYNIRAVAASYVDGILAIKIPLRKHKSTKVTIA